MLVAIVLGNRLNDDGSITDIMRERLELALKVCSLYEIDKIIVSGGVANKVAKCSEADKMYDYLVDNGISPNTIVKESNSLTTKQNAEFSVPIAVELGATEILLCTSSEHMNRRFLNPIKLFKKNLRKYSNITLKTYCG